MNKTYSKPIFHIFALFSLLAMFFGMFPTTPARAAVSVAADIHNLNTFGATPLNGQVYAIAISGTDLYAGGSFTDAGGDTNADHIAKWNGTSWSALGTGLNGVVYTIAVSGTDVYAGGEFYQAGGDLNADYIAKWNGTSWSALGATPLDSTVYSIVVNGTDLYVGGYFSDAGGDSNADDIAKWNGTSWSALGAGLNSAVRAIAISGTDLYVGGYFTDAGGDSNADLIAKWNGISWSALGAGLNNGGSYADVTAIAVSGTNVYAGGHFSNAGGDPNADAITVWNSTAWSSLGNSPLLGIEGDTPEIYAIAINGSVVYVGGDFLEAGGNTNANYIAKLDGSSWAAVGAGLNYDVNALVTNGTELFVGGRFMNASDDPNADYITSFGVSSDLAAKNITTFNFASAAAVGVITGTDVAVTVPYGTNVTALVPTVIHTGASVNPNNSVAQDFTNPVTYTVTATDASTKNYTVTVTVSPNPAKDLTAFSFTNPAATGVITGANIAVTVPYGTNLAALVATFTTTGASVAVGATPQISGTTANNFTNPVTYIITAADATTKNYTVTVILAPNPAKDITVFRFNNPVAVGVITGTNIAIKVPFGTNVTALAPTITHTGVFISPNSDVAQDFTSPVTYTVTAADSTTKVYTITVIVALNPAKAITAFAIPGKIGATIINQAAGAITLFVPAGTNKTALVATFTTTGVSAKVGSTIQVSGTTANNFTNPVIYKVTAADASTKNYTVTVITNIPPVAANNAYAVSKNQPYFMSPSVLKNDTDVNADSLKAILVAAPRHAFSFFLDPDGRFSYRPAKDYVGTDTFAYKANDGKANSNVATVTITINPPSVFQTQSLGEYDGWVRESYLNSDKGGVTSSKSDALKVGDDNQNRRIYSMLDFNTAVLPNKAVITKVILNIDLDYGRGNPFVGLGYLVADIRKGFFGNSRILESLDYQATSSVNAVGKFTQVGRSTIWQSVLDSDGRGNINLVGVTQFRLRFEEGDDDDFIEDSVIFFSGDALPSANWHPKLIIEYYIP